MPKCGKRLLAMPPRTKKGRGAEAKSWNGRERGKGKVLSKKGKGGALDIDQF